MLFKLVLLAIKKPPPTPISEGMEMFDKFGLSTKASAPPVWVKFGAEKVSNVSE